MSQRDTTFKGGIQSGSVATDSVARRLDDQCKTIKESMHQTFKSSGLTMQRKLTKDQIPGGVGACEPDGGAWFYNDKLVAVFEGKKQGKQGNAIERWFKNNYTCRMINPDVHYVTFCVGEGAAENEVLQKTLKIAHLKGFNQFNPNDNSVYYSVDGFTDTQIEDVMKTVLKKVVSV
jgi:hypothetical protein